MSTFLSTHRMLHVSRYFFGADERAGAFPSDATTDPQLRRRETLEEVARALQAAGPGVTNIQAVVAATPVQPEEIDLLFGDFSGLLNALVEAVAQSVLAPLALAGEGRRRVPVDAHRFRPARHPQPPLHSFRARSMAALSPRSAP